MLNLRLAQPALLVDITRIPELAAVSEDADAITIGATVTHAAVEDGRIPDPTGGFLRQVACGIAYRAVRNRGTIGGSLAHADPAADWLSCLTALGAQVVLAGAAGTRRVGLASFVRGAMETELADNELIVAVRIPRFSRSARFGFHKICRKTGEFADAIGVVAYDPDRQLTRLAASTSAGAPIVLDAPELHLDRGQLPDTADLQQRLVQAGLAGDAYVLKLHTIAVRRAIAQVLAP
jgi:carbon-monoxide dehydrogenase medium subunit